MDLMTDNYPLISEIVKYNIRLAATSCRWCWNSNHPHPGYVLSRKSFLLFSWCSIYYMTWGSWGMGVSVGGYGKLRAIMVAVCGKVHRRRVENGWVAVFNTPPCLFHGQVFYSNSRHSLQEEAYGMCDQGM